MSFGHFSNRFGDEPARFETLVLKELQRWWDAVNTDAKLKELVEDECLSKPEYVVFYERLVYAFNNDGDDENDLDKVEARIAMQVDWENDSGGGA